MQNLIPGRKHSKCLLLFTLLFVLVLVHDFLRGVGQRHEVHAPCSAAHLRNETVHKVVVRIVHSVLFSKSGGRMDKDVLDSLTTVFLLINPRGV